MKIATLVGTVTLPTVVALQGMGYLSQLNGASVVAPQPFGVPNPPTTTATTVGPSQELMELFSKQVSQELHASQVYLSASIWFRAHELSGMSAWALEESGEEREHGLSILEFANKRKFPVILNPLQAPRSDWESVVEVWQDILQLEQDNTKCLLTVAAAADRCHDYGSLSFLGPFHEEQIDAEDKIGKILAKLKNSPEMMGVVDHELGMEDEDDDD